MALNPPLFVSPKADPSVDPTLLQPSHWNRAIALLNGLFDGGDPHGSVLARDTSDQTDGGRWLPSAAGVLACDAPGSVPVFRPLTAADLPSGAVPAHHATHETGGTDAITALDGSVITTGTVASLRIGSHHTHHDTGGSDAIANLSAAVLTSGTLANARLDPNVAVTTSLSIGTNPAANAAIRLTSGQGESISSRNAAGTADISVIGLDQDNLVRIRQGVYVSPTTLASYTDGAYSLGISTNRFSDAYLSNSVSIGTNPATTGAIRLANTQQIVARNSANTGDVILFNCALGDRIVAWTDVIPAANASYNFGVDSQRWASGYFASNINIGAPGTTATTGAIRLANNQGINSRNVANNGDLNLMKCDAGNWIRLGDVNGALTVDSATFAVQNLSFVGPNYDIGTSGTRARNIFVGSSVVNKVKAGTPTDADVTSPTDGMLMLDSTANKIWVRLGGVWKGVVVA